MKVVVTGATGLLSAAMLREFSLGHEVVGLERAQLDVASADGVARMIAAERPALIVNCAAYNDVDAAEAEPARALHVNAFAVETLARASATAGATLLHFSSDFVFDGETDRPYTEADRANPLGVYAASKLLGEWFALETAGTYVLRVESLFGPSGGSTRRGSLGTIVDAIREGREIPLFVDRIVSPSFTVDVARAARALIEQAAPAGLYHCVNTGQASWAEIAAYAATDLGAPLRFRPLTLATAGLRAKRPRYSALSNAKLASVGITMPPWQSAVSEFLTLAT